ncbi:hypothetical protein [Rhodococcus sp. X156]|uniref:hypothetical protein n=1 Tax=Rhodococcus sp. X156 TaxID=2499145 RepID=UPI000FD99EAF|nr:hypothetical protein [Rhodococcus sp. X156]
MTAAAPGPPTREAYLSTIGAALQVLTAADPARPVVLGPGTDVAEVMSWAAVFATGVTEQLSSTALVPRRAPEQAKPLDVAGEKLLGALSRSPSRRPCWSPSPAVAPQAGFWLRRSAHALSVRAWQVQVAMEVPAALPPWLLLDGIDEHLTVLLATAAAEPGSATAEAAGTVAVRCTDVPASWTLRLDPGAVPLPLGVPTGLVDPAGHVAPESVSRRGAASGAASEAVLAADAATLRLGLAGMVVLPRGTGSPELLAGLRVR